jgi:hypothetical protein
VKLHPYQGPRGLRGFTQFTDHYGAQVMLQESSAVATVNDQGAVLQIVTTGSPQFAWLRISGEHEDGSTMHASAHLTRDNAEELRDALDAFLATLGEET